MQKMNVTEALYGFMGWLTCRDEPLTLSAGHDAARPAELVREFLKANCIDEPISEDWPKNLIHPKR